MKQVASMDGIGSGWEKRQRTYAAILLLLWTAFLLRVTAQWLQLVSPVSWLPPFSMWHSGILSYPFLRAVQLLLLLVMASLLIQLGRARIRYNRRAALRIRTIGRIYFLIMLFRLFAGQVLLTDVHWFASPIPSLFHLVLAAFLLVYARLHICFEEESDEAKN